MKKGENISTKISELLRLTRQKLIVQGNAIFMQKVYYVVLKYIKIPRVHFITCTRTIFNSCKERKAEAAVYTEGVYP